MSNSWRLCFSVLLDIYLEVELLNHTVILCLMFRKTSVLFSTVAVPFYIHTSGAWGFQFLHILVNTLFSGVFFFFFFFNSSHPNGYEAQTNDSELIIGEIIFGVLDWIRWKLLKKKKRTVEIHTHTHTPENALLALNKQAALNPTAIRKGILPTTWGNLEAISPQYSLQIRMQPAAISISALWDPKPRTCQS